jgi:hypothetical protein
MRLSVPMDHAQRVPRAADSALAQPKATWYSSTTAYQAGTNQVLRRPVDADTASRMLQHARPGQKRPALKAITPRQSQASATSNSRTSPHATAVTVSSRSRATSPEPPPPATAVTAAVCVLACSANGVKLPRHPEIDGAHGAHRHQRCPCAHSVPSPPDRSRCRPTGETGGSSAGGGGAAGGANGALCR